MIVHRPLTLSWRGASFDTAPLQRFLDAWNRTPYADTAPECGARTSCLGFICAAWDVLSGRTDGLEGIPRDVGLVDPTGMKRAMRWFLERYAPFRLTHDQIQPGDVLVVGPEELPAHVMLVGTRRNTLWHSTEDLGVHYTGMSLAEPFGLHSIYRLPTL